MALGELKCPSLDYVYRMTWAEFRIRLHAYNRLDKKEWYKVREIAWNSLISFNVDPKKLPKTKESFIPLEKKKQDPNKEARRKRIAEVQRVFAEQKRKRENG